MFARTAPFRCTATLAGVGLLLAACSDAGTPAPTSPGEPENLSVVTAFYPLHFLAEQVGGDLVGADDLTPSGADPHDLELSPVDVAMIEQADVVVYLSGFQPAVDAAMEQVSGPVGLDLAEVVDLQDTSATVRSGTDSGTASDDEHAHDDHGHDDDHNDDHAHDDDHARDDDHNDQHAHDDDHDGHDHGTEDPHFWLDTERMATAAHALAEALGQTATEHAGTFEANAAQLQADLDALDEHYRTTLASCSDEVMLVSHLAFGYLAMRYDLTQVGIAGLDPHVEPSPARLAEIRAVVLAEGVNTIFVDPLASARVSDALAAELDLQVLTLDSLENLHPPATDYFEVMEANLEALAEGLTCR
ncbi:metal ABC transporter substrate-binding protein [Pseudactinotalea sp. Z1732]|uniref:metal ABC transporter substrate-binding protein n=1 Tax=Pseudactinotalea sp. Z1732 TaxID=3413026 RepID=UPI003C7C96A1